MVRFENEIVIFGLSLEWSRPYDQNGHVEVTYKMFCKEQSLVAQNIYNFLNNKYDYIKKNLEQILRFCKL